MLNYKHTPVVAVFIILALASFTSRGMAAVTEAPTWRPVASEKLVSCRPIILRNRSITILQIQVLPWPFPMRRRSLV